MWRKGLRRQHGVALLLAAVWAFSAGASEPGGYAKAWKKACALRRARDYAGARGAGAEALKLAATPKEKAAAHLLIGECCRRTRRYDEAVSELRKVLEMTDASARDKASAQAGIGETYAWQGRHEKAREAYGKVLEMPGADDNRKADARACIAHALRALGKYNEAIAEYNQVIEAKGVRPSVKAKALCHLGQTYMHTYATRRLPPDAPRDYAKARAAFEKMLAMKRGPSTAYRAWAQNSIGLSYYLERDYAGARAAYGKTLRIPRIGAASRATALLGTADCYFDEREYGKAREAYAKVAEMKGAGAKSRAKARERIKKLKNILAD